MCAIYACNNNLLELEGWQQFKSIANHELKFRHLVNQVKLQLYPLMPHYKYGYKVPCDYKHAMEPNTFFVAGPEFGDLVGHTLVIEKALNGLQTNRACWHNQFADCLCDMGFEPSKGKPDIWMWQNGDVYEYIGVYINDLAIIAKDP